MFILFSSFKSFKVIQIAKNPFPSFMSAAPLFLSELHFIEGTLKGSFSIPLSLNELLSILWLGNMYKTSLSLALSVLIIPSLHINKMLFALLFHLLAYNT
jgi:hypothetical protein